MPSSPAPRLRRGTEAQGCRGPGGEGNENRDRERAWDGRSGMAAVRSPEPFHRPLRIGEGPDIGRGSKPPRPPPGDRRMSDKIKSPLSVARKAGIGERGCRECKTPIPPGATFCGYSCRSKQTNRLREKIMAKARTKAVAKMRESKGRPRPPSRQARGLEAFYTEARIWYWEQVRLYAEHYEALGVPAVHEYGSTVCGMHRYGGCWGPMEVDHTMTRRDKDPAHLQTLCGGHNRAKGSRKGRAWDFREERFKTWLREARDRDWVYNSLKSRWERRRHGRSTDSDLQDQRSGGSIL